MNFGMVKRMTFWIMNTDRLSLHQTAIGLCPVIHTASVSIPFSLSRNKGFSASGSKATGNTSSVHGFQSLSQNLYSQYCPGLCRRKASVIRNALPAFADLRVLHDCCVSLTSAVRRDRLSSLPLPFVAECRCAVCAERFSRSDEALQMHLGRRVSRLWPFPDRGSISAVRLW